MKNPFLDFHPGKYHKKEHPAEVIVRAKRDVMDGIIEGYLRLVEGEVKDLAWLVEHDRVVKAYASAVERVRDIQYDSEDIEAFCAKLDSSDSIPYMIPGPAGLYLSALVNHSKEDSITLKLEDFQRTFHFLGYGLPGDKTLVLQGNGGDFTGVGLGGGNLIVHGSAGNWCGAGMINGKILVSKHTGHNTGEWMQGGEIHVDGRIGSVGKTIFGGRIYQDGKLIASQNS